MPWQGLKNFVSQWFREIGVFSLFLFLALVASCERDSYDAKTLRIKIPIKSTTPKSVEEPKEDSPIDTAKKSEKASDGVKETPAVDPVLGKAREEWGRLSNELRDKGLGKDDLIYLEPRASDVESLLEGGDGRVLPRIGELRRRVSSFELSPGYLWQKLERVRAKFSKRNLSGKEIQDYQQRLEAIPRLIEEDRLNIANSVLSDVYFELGNPSSEN